MGHALKIKCTACCGLSEQAVIKTDLYQLSDNRLNCAGERLNDTTFRKRIRVCSICKAKNTTLEIHEEDFDLILDAFVTALDYKKANSALRSQINSAVSIFGLRSSAIGYYKLVSKIFGFEEGGILAYELTSDECTELISASRLALGGFPKVDIERIANYFLIDDAEITNVGVEGKSIGDIHKIIRLLKHPSRSRKFRSFLNMIETR